MSTIAEETVAAFKTLFDKVAELQEIHIRDLLLPDKYKAYRTALDAAYDALVRVEDALDAIGMKLEYQHWRIGSALEEIMPLLIQRRSTTDRALENMRQDGERQ